MEFDADADFSRFSLQRTQDKLSPVWSKAASATSTCMVSRWLCVV